MKDWRTITRIDANASIVFAGIGTFASEMLCSSDRAVADAVDTAIADTIIDRRSRLVFVYDPDPALACLLPVYDHIIA